MQLMAAFLRFSNKTDDKEQIEMWSMKEEGEPILQIFTVLCGVTSKSFITIVFKYN